MNIDDRLEKLGNSMANKTSYQFTQRKPPVSIKRRKASKMVLAAVISMLLLLTVIVAVTPLRETLFDTQGVSSGQPNYKTTASGNLGPQGNMPSYLNFSLFSYYSFAEFYRELKNMPEDILKEIQGIEKENARKDIHISREEEQYGLFGFVRNKLLEEKKLLFPFFKGEQVPLLRKISAEHNYEIPCIQLSRLGANGKPSISYSVIFNNISTLFSIQFYDETFIKDANEKGASWLIAQISPDALNVHNYEKHNKVASDFRVDGVKDKTVVYEKEFQLGDRKVLAMVTDRTFEPGWPITIICFVYDNMLVEVSFIPEDGDIAENLRDITFHKINFVSDELFTYYKTKIPAVTENKSSLPKSLPLIIGGFIVVLVICLAIFVKVKFLVRK